ncbi:O-antigen polysaccharide polymerase Wzy [Eudoraea sp.]|uniref:O-antigen polysaccharide polymerase Wzy n=1 Tax=Eudoraea sp. TaxID=1979955 RepID=UPI003C7364A8
MRIPVAILLCFLSIISLILEWFTLGLSLSLLAYGIILYHTFKTVGLNSVLFLFMILFGLYGYSVPISVFFDSDIGWHRVAKLRTWQKVDDTLFSFLISNQLALLATSLLYLVFVRKRIMRIPNSASLKVSANYYRLAILAGILSSLSEALNFLRAGGFATLSQGKAFYQGAINDLVLNIPYEGFFYISIALFGQFFATVKNKKDKYFTYLPPFFLSIFFVLFINLIIGERGTLLVAMVVFILAYTIKRRITRINVSYVLLLSLLYVCFNALTLLREKSVEYKGIGNFLETYEDRLYRLMNPANTEFGSPALNYRIFIDKRPDNYNYKLGQTYTEISTAFIPRYIYPNKPIGIIYEFRNQYFPERKEMGSTAGTGFSSLLEAYMNFGYFGPFFIYLIFLFFLIYMESRKGRNQLFIDLLYLLLFNVFLIFSRSASQYILYTLFLYLCQIIVVILVYKVIPKRMFSISKVIDA